MANNIKRNGGKRVRKGLSEKGKKTIKKALVLLAFALLGLSFLVSIIGPSVDTFIVRDNYTYVMQHGNPTNYEAKDEAYLEYVNTINKYQASDNHFVSLFFNANSIEKIGLIAVAMFLMYPFVSKTYKFCTTD